MSAESIRMLGENLHEHAVEVTAFRRASVPRWTPIET